MKRAQLRIPAVLRRIPPLCECCRHAPPNAVTKFKSEKLLSGDIPGIIFDKAKLETLWMSLDEAKL